MELVKGSVAVSLRGRDKGVLLCVIGTSGNRVCVCDGKHSRLSKPKLKNPKHIRPLNKKLSEEQTASDKSIRKALKQMSEA